MGYRARVEIHHKAPAKEADAEKNRNTNPDVVIHRGDAVDAAMLGASEQDMKELIRRGHIEEVDDKGTVVSPVPAFGPGVVPPRDQDPAQHKPAEEQVSVKVAPAPNTGGRPTLSQSEQAKGK